jgi:hypothetical protein
MERLVYAVWGATGLLTQEFRDRLACKWVQVNVDDADVSPAQLRLTTFDEAINAFVTVPVDAAPMPEGFGRRWCGWRVETEEPIAPPVVPDGERADALTNIAVLRRPDDLPYDAWLHRWKHDHTPVGISAQGNFGYIQNRVLEPMTPGAPDVAAIVEELFPMEAMTDWHAFYGSGGDDAELGRRMTQMLESVSRFGADRDIDVVPTSRYVWHS